MIYTYVLYICICICTYICTQIYIYIYIHVCVCVYYICIYLHVLYIYIHIYRHIYTYMYGHTHTCIRMYTHACIYPCICARTHIHVTNRVAGDPQTMFCLNLNRPIKETSLPDEQHSLPFSFNTKTASKTNPKRVQQMKIVFTYVCACHTIFKSHIPSPPPPLHACTY